MMRTMLRPVADAIVPYVYLAVGVILTLLVLLLVKSLIVI
jgi:hypothetical protein